MTRDQILAGNEAVHRSINEAIERGQWPGEEPGTPFRCECARRGCTGMLALTRAQYEGVRADPRRFVVLPGHQQPDIEDVVEVASGYVVVEKRGESGRVAEATYPRS